MKKALILLTIPLSGCVAGLPEDPRCPEGTVLHTSPAGNERCIKPGMKVGEGAVLGAVVMTGAALGTGLVVLP